MARGKRARTNAADDLAQQEVAEAKRARPDPQDQAQRREDAVAEAVLVNAPDRREVMADVARRWVHST